MGRIHTAFRRSPLTLLIVASLTLVFALGGRSKGTDNTDEVKLVGVLQLIDALDPIADGLEEGLAKSGYVDDLLILPTPALTGCLLCSASP